MPTNLITTGDYKVYKSINSSTDDAIISLLVGVVTDFIKNYTGRSLIDYAHTVKIEYFDATMYHRYFPLEFPLLSVSAVDVSIDGGVTYTTLVENTDYFVDTQEDSIDSNTNLVGFVSSTIKKKSGRITYKGGYEQPPYDLRIAAMDLIEFHRKAEYSPSKSIQSSSIENPVNIIVGSQLPPHIKRVLDNYRVL
jgi:hypothetical protein